MINIKEGQSKKAVGQTSLFVSFDYDPKIVEIIKGAEDAIWHKNEKVWELPLNKLAYLIDNLTYFDDINLDILETKPEEELELSINYRTEPFEYQKEDIKWLINNPNSLNLNMPGLGKTLELIYTAEELHKQKGIEHCLIICGINTLKQNWKREIQTHSNLDCIVIGEKINKKGNITYSSVADRAEQLFQPIKEFFVIINIESIRDDLVLSAIKDSKNNFDMLVLDECHKAKSIKSEQGKNLLKLAKIGKYNYGLTGTVLVNSPLDAYAALKFVGREKSNFSTFKAFYCVIDYMFGHQQITGYKNIDMLKETLSKFSIRRDKSILNLPPKVIVPEYLEMPTSQADFYSDLQNGIIEEADRVDIKNTSLLGLITRLRQATSCPSVLSSKAIDNVKLDRALELIEEITSNNEKVIVYSVFKEPLYKLFNLIPGGPVPNVLLCTGDQSEKEIDENIEAFQNDPTKKIILCTSQKMGTGLTLTAASYEIFLDSAWTYSEFEQACDRAHRIGSKNTVFIYYLMAKNTIDERVYKLINTKKDISDYIVDNKTETEELKYLLGL